MARLNCILLCYVIHLLTCTLITLFLYFYYFPLWITYLFFFIVVDWCEEKIALWRERNLTQWRDCSMIIFVWVTFYCTRSFLSCYYFVKKEKIYIHSCFSNFSFSFIRQYWLFEISQLKSSVNLKIGNLEFQVVIATFVYATDFFNSLHLHILVSVFDIFLHFSLTFTFQFLHVSRLTIFWISTRWVFFDNSELEPEIH